MTEERTAAAGEAAGRLAELADEPGPDWVPPARALALAGGPS